MRSLLFVFLISSFTCIAQIANKKGTIKVKKVPVDYTLVDEQPLFPGGQIAMDSFLLDNVNCLGQKINGTIDLSFVVEEDGSVSNVKMLSGVPGANCWNSEILRVIKIMPKWLPGRVKGVAVRTKLDFPVRILMDAFYPSFPGGYDAMEDFIKKNKIDPESPKYKGISDNSEIKFVVNEDGSISDITVAYPISGCKACDEEALRIVKSMPKWIPAKFNGKNYKSQGTVMVHFKFSS